MEKFTAIKIKVILWFLTFVSKFKPWNIDRRLSWRYSEVSPWQRCWGPRPSSGGSSPACPGWLASPQHLRQMVWSFLFFRYWLFADYNGINKERQIFNKTAQIQTFAILISEHKIHSIYINISYEYHNFLSDLDEW